MKGGSLEQSLGLLVSMAIAQVEGASHCAFYLANAEGTKLRHVGDMPERHVCDTQGCKHCAEVCACDLPIGAAGTVLTPDVREAPSWQLGLRLADKYGFRGCWSFPLESEDGTRLGTFVLYFGEPHAPTPAELELARSISTTASVIVGHHQIRSRLQAAAERQSFLLKLSDALRPLSEPVEIQRAAMRAIGEHLAVDRVIYAELEADGKHFSIAQNYVREGFLLLTGRFPTEALGPIAGPLAAGETVVVLDVETSALTNANQAAYHAEGIAAMVGVPLVKNGRWLSNLSAHSAVPRAWREDEILLLQQTAERTWDAVERARVEQALRDKEEEFRAMADNIDQLAWICDETLGNVTWYNQRWLDFTGLDLEQMKGWDWSKVQHPDHVTRVVAGVKQSSESGEPWDDTFPLRSKNGDYRWFLSRAVPIRNADGRIVRWFGTNTDVTEQREIEAALREREAQLQVAARAKDEFLAMLGHELRNPLSPIVTTLELMKLRAPNTLAQERRVIEKQVQHLSGLIDDLLDVARIVRGTLEITSVSVTIDEVVAVAVETSQPLFEERNQTLHVTVERGLMVKGDPRRLVQVLVNLLTNAAKYSPRNSEVELKAAADNGEVVLRVRDEGQGIDPGLLETVFEAFTQEPQALDRSRGGLGLGLAIVRNLVRLHRGSVTAWSEGRNRGSEFTVRLPLLARDEAPHAKAAAAEDRIVPAAGAKRLKVLVVDDYQLAAESLAALLQAFGFDTCVAHDGAEALRMIEQVHPDVALLDIGLPVVDGYEVARTVRHTPGSERLPLIALTGYGQDSDRARAIKAGFNEHVAKPVNVKRIEQLINQLVKAE